MSAFGSKADVGGGTILSAALKKKTSLRLFRVATSTSRHRPSHWDGRCSMDLQVQRQRVQNCLGCVGLPGRRKSMRKTRNVVDRCGSCSGCHGDYRQCPNAGVWRQQSPCPNSKGYAFQKRGLQRMGSSLSARKGMAMRSLRPLRVRLVLNG